MSRFGGLGIQSLNSLTPASMQAIQQAINSFIQTSQFQQDQDRRRKEAEANRKAQKKAQKRAFGQQVGLLAGTAGVSALVGGGLGALESGAGGDAVPIEGNINAGPSDYGDASSAVNKIDFADGGQSFRDYAPGTIPDTSSGNNQIGVFQPPGPQPSSVPSTFTNQTFVDAPTDQISQLQSGSQPIGLRGDTLLTTGGINGNQGLPGLTPGEQAIGDLGGPTRNIPSNTYGGSNAPNPQVPQPGFQQPKYTFGDTLGSSIARGALYGLGSRVAPGLIQNAINLPFQYANLGLAADRNAIAARSQANLEDYRNRSLELDQAQLGSLEDYRESQLDLGQQRVDAYKNRPSSTLSDDQVEEIIGGVVPRLDSIPEEDADSRHALIERTLKDYKFSPEQRSTVTDLFYKKYKYSPRSSSTTFNFEFGGTR